MSCMSERIRNASAGVDGVVAGLFRPWKEDSSGRSEAGGQAAAVDVAGFEDFQDRLGRDAPLLGPDNDVEVLLALFEAVEDAIEQEGFVNEATLQQAEVPAVEFDPEALALQMLQPAGAQVAPPVTLDPATDRCLAEIVAGALALDAFVAKCFLLAVHVIGRLVRRHHGFTPLVVPVRRDWRVGSFAHARPVSQSSTESRSIYFSDTNPLF